MRGLLLSIVYLVSAEKKRPVFFNVDSTIGCADRSTLPSHPAAPGDQR